LYVTDSLKFLNNNVANALGGNVIEKRFADIVYRADDDQNEENQESSEDIKKRISQKVRGY